MEQHADAPGTLPRHNGVPVAVTLYSDDQASRQYRTITCAMSPERGQGWREGSIHQSKKLITVLFLSPPKKIIRPPVEFYILFCGMGFLFHVIIERKPKTKSPGIPWGVKIIYFLAEPVQTANYVSLMVPHQSLFTVRISWGNSMMVFRKPAAPGSRKK